MAPSQGSIMQQYRIRRRRERRRVRGSAPYFGGMWEAGSSRALHMLKTVRERREPTGQVSGLRRVAPNGGLRDRRRRRSDGGVGGLDAPDDFGGLPVPDSGADLRGGVERLADWR